MSQSSEIFRGRKTEEMGVDLRQVVAGVLTITMFVMLGNMIKREHFDSVHVSPPNSRNFPP